MNIRVIRNMLRILETKSLTEAANLANQTVQAIASQLNKLEDRLDIALFQRSSRGLVPTPNGIILLSQMKRIVDEADNLNEQVRSIHGNKNKTLRLAMNTTLRHEVNGPILACLTDALSDFQIEFFGGESPDNLRNLQSSTVDLAVLIGPAPPHTPYITLSSIGIKAVVAECRRNSVDRGSNEWKYVIQPADSCPYYAGFERYYSEYIRCNDHKFDQKRTIISSSEALTVSLIKKYNAIGVVSESTAQENHLNIFPNSAILLPIQLCMNNSTVSGEVWDRMERIGTITSRAC